MLCLCFFRSGVFYTSLLGLGENGRYRHTGEVAFVPATDKVGGTRCPHRELGGVRFGNVRLVYLRR